MLRLTLVLLIAVPFVTGCKSAEEMSAACLRGERSACEGACSQGVGGKGGCMSAAEAHAPKDRATAGAYYVKACEAGEPHGCLMSASYVVPPVGSAPLKTEWMERAVTLFVKACESGDRQACREVAARRHRSAGRGTPQSALAPGVSDGRCRGVRAGHFASRGDR